MAKAASRPLGSAHRGVEHWIVQRATAIALVPLGLWFVVSMLGLAGADYEDVRAWLGGQFNATMMILLVVAAFWHAKLGLEVVIQDYVHGRAAKIASLLATNFLVWLFAVSSILAILQVATGS